VKALAFPFQFGGGAKQSAPLVTTDYDQIVRGQIIDALMTNLGERKMRPRHGCDIQSALFDPSQELERSDAAGLIKARLGVLVPRALVRSVQIDAPGYGSRNFAGVPGEVYITVQYRSTPYSQDSTVAVPVASEFLNRQRTGEIR
jgi:phage baseplate assembly protein W